MESPLSFFRMHWDHEPTRNRSAGFPACGFTGHSCPVFLLRATGKSPEPADRNVCPRHPRSMGSFYFVATGFALRILELHGCGSVVPLAATSWASPADRHRTLRPVPL